MAESNADKMYKLGQELGAARTSLNLLKEKVAQGGDMAATFALQAKTKALELATREKELAKLAALKGSALGAVVDAAENIALKVGGKRLAALAAGPVGAALSIASDATAAEDLGPQKGSAAYKLEMGEKLTPAEEQELRPKKYNIGGLVDESPEYGLKDGGSPEELLGKSVSKNLNNDDARDEMAQIRKQYPEYENVSDEVLIKAIRDRRASSNKKADGGFVYDVDPAQLGMGIRTELEHTDDANVAMKIAMDHLAEDPKYYTKLQKVEGKELAEGGKVHAANGYTPGEGKRRLQESIDKYDDAHAFSSYEDEENYDIRQLKKIPVEEESAPNYVDEDIDMSSYKKGEGKKRLLEAISKLKDGGTPDKYTPGEGKRRLQEAIDKYDDEHAFDSNQDEYDIRKLNKLPEEEPVPHFVDEDIDLSQYKKGEGKKRLLESISNYNKLKKGGLVDGDEDEYAGDPIDAKLNKNELVLNVEQQQKLIDILNNRKTKLPTHDRVDNLLNKKELSIDEDEQLKLFSFIKGETSKKPKGNIVVKHFEDGGADQIPNIDQVIAQEPQQVPLAPNAPAPISPINARPVVGLPEAAKYTGPNATPRGTLPVEAPVNLSDIEVPKAEASPEQNQADVLQVKGTLARQKQLQDAAVEEQLANAKASAAVAKTKAIVTADLADKAIIAKNAQDAEIRNIAFNNLKSQDEAIKKSSEGVGESALSKFFAKESTLGKIFFGAALALSTWASLKTGSNPILNYINKNIEDDLDAKKLDASNYMAMKNHYLDIQKMEIAKQAANTNSAEAKVNAKLAIAKIGEIQQNLQTQRLQMSMAQAQQQMLRQAVGSASKEGIPLESVNALPKELQERAVRMPNDKAKFAFDKERAQKVTEYANEVVPAINGAKRILDVAKDLNRVTDLEKRARISSEMKALGGQLRLPFTGPGILTDKEFDRLMDTIGDPNQLVALPSLQKAKLETVISKLQKDLATHYKNAGVPVQSSPNEKNIQTLIKNNKGMSEYDAERALKRAGFWTQE